MTTIAQLRTSISGRYLGVAAAALASAGALAVYVLWTAAQFGGDTVTVAFEDVAEAAVAALAAAACVYAGVRSSGRVRGAWLFFAASASSWAAGEVVWTVYEAGLGRAVPFPSFADLGYVVAVPLAVAGVLSFPFSPSRRVNRIRVVVDGAIAAAAFTFVAWAFVLDGVVQVMPAGAMGRVLALAYPAADFMIAAMVVMGWRRARGGLRVVAILLVAAFDCMLVADSSFAYLTLTGGYGALGSVLDAGWVAGYMVLGLAALWPAREHHEIRDDSAVEVWQLAIPWVAVLVVIVSTVWTEVAGIQLGRVVAWIGASLGLLFVASQILMLNDTLQLLVRSRRAEAQLAERTRLLNDVITRAPVGIERVGYDMRIIDANPSVCAMLRAPAKIVIGSRVQDYLTDEETAKLLEKFVPLVKGEVDSVEAESHVRRADGSLIWVHWSVTVVRQPNGRVDYFLPILEDVTSKHEMQEAALANVAALERLSRLKSEFMSMVSHEFRTALTGIQGYSEVMNTQEVTPDEVKEFSGDINSDALRLNRMITEMLDLDRIESGRITLHVAPVDLNAILRDAGDRAQMASSKHRVVVELDPTLPQVDGDADRLTQVVANLLSNAIKYSPNGGDVMVTSSFRDGAVEVSVRDHGQGIPLEFQSRIFGRYERYEGGGNNQVVGTGLGLAIAQQIMQLHKGKIWVESVPGDGSLFRFTIPAKKRVPAAGSTAA